MSTPNTTEAATLVLQGVGIADVTSHAVNLYRAVLAGRWSAVADYTTARLANPGAARAELDALAGGRRVAHAPMTVTGEVWLESCTGHERDLIAALDLYQRILIGQWRELAWVTNAAHRDGPADVGDACDRIRHRHQKPGGYPAHPRASWSIHNGPAEAVVAYDAWKALGGGVAERGFAGSGVRVERAVPQVDAGQESA